MVEIIYLAQKQTTKGMAIKIQGMVPLLHVFDMPTSILFYRDKIDFNVVDPTNDHVDWALLRFSDVDLMLNTACEKQNRPPDRAEVRKAAHADISAYFGCLNVDAVYVFLSEKGTALEKPMITSHGWNGNLHFRSG